ncbi:hypothetical protein FRC12_004685 [Ceratobasidium sp. 428]|nr:hypothetical protein FRC12_004685 [Ceratobasidium sp. 428]
MFETEDIRLTSINIAQGKSTDENQHPTAARATSTQTPTTASRIPAYQQLANETPGHELAPEASIWEMHVEEEKEHDGELMESENKNLDNLLLFVRRSVLCHSHCVHHRVKRQLQQDPADASVALLLVIAQSQRRIEQGNPEVLAGPVEVPVFSSSTASRWINALWFTALALSLAAALVALLAKEWLTVFMAHRPHPPHAYALLHQRRLQGLKGWGALHMIDLLPSMLHLSLLLFSLGMAIYLWTIDLGIAILVMIITGSTVIFYAGTTVLGAMYESCPFVTQVSRYLPAFVEVLPLAQHGAVRDSRGTPTDNSEATTHEELQALRWLAETARDPQVVDYVCQALIGLQPAVPSVSPNKKPEIEKASGTTWTKTLDTIKRTYSDFIDSKDPSIIWRNNLSYFYGIVRNRIPFAHVFLQRERLESRGMNMAYFLNAAPAMDLCLDSSSPTAAEPLATLGLSVLDYIWSHACPQLIPDVYTAFVVAELCAVVSIAENVTPGPAAKRPGIKGGAAI